MEMKMARSAAGRPQIEERRKTGPGFALADWFNRNLDRLTDMTNEEIADKLGYSRPNIISMWRTGRTRIPLDRLKPLSDILGVEMITLLPLWLEQYIDKEGYQLVEEASKRMVTQDEAELIAVIRDQNDQTPLSAEQKAALIAATKSIINNS